jgi:hypothetical protein
VLAKRSLLAYFDEKKQLLRLKSEFGQARIMAEQQVVFSEVLLRWDVAHSKLVLQPGGRAYYQLFIFPRGNCTG